MWQTYLIKIIDLKKNAKKTMGSKALLTSIYKIRKNPNKSYIKNFSEDPNISEKKLKKYFKSLVINRNNKK